MKKLKKHTDPLKKMIDRINSEMDTEVEQIEEAGYNTKEFTHKAKVREIIENRPFKKHVSKIESLTDM